MKEVAGSLRLGLAQYRELAAFSQFASDLDDATRRQLNRGEKLTEVLKQPQYAPVPVEEQVLALYAVTEGYMDDVAVSDVRRFESELRDFFRGRYAHVLEGIAESGKLPEGDEISEGIASFKETFEGIGTEE